ncbi:MAG TPA: hypothetical protein VFE06_07175, partial [Acidobacteriaceae bacterium]|nr:hypothetical protein [Acidobacteriaceae bacterium]
SKFEQDQDRDPIASQKWVPARSAEQIAFLVPDPILGAQHRLSPSGASAGVVQRERRFWRTSQ